MGVAGPKVLRGVGRDRVRKVNAGALLEDDVLVGPTTARLDPVRGLTPRSTSTPTAVAAVNLLIEAIWNSGVLVHRIRCALVGGRRSPSANSSRARSIHPVPAVQLQIGVEGSRL